MRQLVEEMQKAAMSKLNAWRSNQSEILVWRRIYEREAQTNVRIKAAVLAIVAEMEEDPTIDTEDWQAALTAAFSEG